MKITIEDNGHSLTWLHEVLIEISKDQKIIQKQNQLIIMKQTELAEQLNEQTQKIAKIGTESTKTLQKVTELEAALGNQDNVSPELQTAFDNLKAQVTVVDDLIPDVTGGTGTDAGTGGPGGSQPGTNL